MKRTLWKFTYYLTPDSPATSAGHRSWGAAIDAAHDTGCTYDEPQEYEAGPPATHRAVLKHFRSFGLNLTQGEALCIIAEHEDGIQLGPLARELGVSSATLTGVADTLEKRGFARRRRGMDRRSEWLDITHEGITLTTEKLNQ